MWFGRHGRPGYIPDEVTELPEVFCVFVCGGGYYLGIQTPYFIVFQLGVA